MVSLLSRPLSVRVYEIKAEPSAPQAFGSMLADPLSISPSSFKSSLKNWVLEN